MPESDFFTPILDEDKRTNILSTVSSPVWSGGTATLTAMYTSSVQSASTGDYYYDVYNKAGSDSTREVQFAVSYGHYDGSGSLSTTAGNNPTKAIYRQIRNVCLRNPSSETKFNFNANGEGTTYYAYDIFAINVNRARYREKLDPGNWELRLQSADATKTVKLIDDSGATADSSIKGSQRVFNVISGSVENGTYSEHISAVSESNATAAHGSLGYFYPELGIIALNAYALNQGRLGITLTRSTSTNNNTALELVTAITGSQYFQARREEQIKSSHYFCRVRSDEYNYSQNPTYYTGDNAELINPTFIQDPKAYITTVGLYNDNNELLAVAKLSQPLLKSRDREAIIKVRLDF
jgi:hypothetical protein